jgi:hypothetical protein
MTEPSEAVEELLDAARYGDYEDASAALDGGTPVNSADELGRTGGTDHDRCQRLWRPTAVVWTMHECMCSG